LLTGPHADRRAVGSHSETVDFVHQFRSSEHAHDYAWEGALDTATRATEKIVRAALGGAVQRRPGRRASRVTPLLSGRHAAARGAAVAKAPASRKARCATISAGRLQAITGAAHPLLMLAHALAQAKAGDLILVAAFGQGCDALLFEVTDVIGALPARGGVEGALARRQGGNQLTSAFSPSTTTSPWSAACAPRPTRATPLTTLYRNRDMITGLIGGRCRNCGTLQFPRGRYCVNPKVQCARQPGRPVRFQTRSAKVMS